MGSNKNDQTARRRATQDVIAANRPLFEERMRHYYAEMDLGKWTPRLSADERAEAKAAAKRKANAAKIAALAESAGIGVVFTDDSASAEPTKAEAAVLANEHVSNAIRDTFNGTAETVEVDWRGDQDGFADEQEEANTVGEGESAS